MRLDHFEGRTWQGRHHHALLYRVSLLFLHWLRLAQVDGLFGESVPAIRRWVAGEPSRRCQQLRQYCLCRAALFGGP